MQIGFTQEMQMGSAARLAIVYVLLIIITALAFAKKKKAVGIITAAIMVLGLFALGYFWITSPM